MNSSAQKFQRIVDDHLDYIDPQDASDDLFSMILQSIREESRNEVHRNPFSEE